MDTITRTFPIKLTSAYIAGSIIEFCHFRDMLFDADERVSVYLESFFCNLNLKSFLLGVIAEFDGDESEAEKMAKFTAAENKSQKLGLRILNRKNNTGDWEEVAEIILINRGRKDYFDLLKPYLAKNQVAILEKNDALAIQLIDYGNGLLKEGDSLRIVSGVTITISKKNDVEALQARISALELAVEGKLINLPSNTLLGRDVNTGTVEIISQSKFATPAMLDQAIIDLVGGSPGALNTLVELASALNNDANFAATVTNALAQKIGKTGNDTISGNKTFSESVRIQGLFPGIWLDETDHAIKGAFLVIDGGALQVQRRSTQFGNFEATMIALNILTGDVTLSGKLTATLPTSPTGLSPGTFWRNGNTVQIV